MRCLVLPAFILAAAAASPAQLPRPPFVRAWTYLSGNRTAIAGVRGRTVYYTYASGVGAVDLDTGQPRWRALPGKWIAGSALRGDTLYILSEAEKSTTLLALDLRTRRSRTLATLNPRTAAFEVDATRIYVMCGDGVLRAYDRDSGRPLWSRPLLENGRGFRLSAQLLVTAGGLFAGVDGAGEAGIDPKTGRVLWKRDVKYPALYPAFPDGGAVISQAGGLARIDVRTGRVVWKDGETYGDAQLFRDRVLSTTARELIGRDAATGRVVWRLPLRDRDTAYGRSADDPGALSDGTAIWLRRQPFLCVTRDGKELWAQKEPFTGAPTYADGQQVVTTDGERILRYRPGQHPALPADDAARKALAQRLAGQFELLDEAERQQLGQLSPHAFPALLSRYVEWATSYKAMSAEAKSQSLYSLLTDALPLLHATCRKEDTPALVAALTKLGDQSDWRGQLEGILAAKGDPAGFVPVLVRKLRALPPEQREDSPALSAVSHAAHPEAVAFLLEALRDPKAPPDWRRAAFQHLPGIGGEEAREAVRRARPKPGARPPWWERIHVGKIAGKQLLGEKTDRSGQTWRLFQSEVLGNHSDLFVARKRGDHWERPLFTGAWTERTFTSPAPATFRGIPIARLRDTEWIRIFPDDPTIRKDTDGDGLTDVVEERLSLDPQKPDTDGDGTPDAVDPCPNAAPRRLGETEQIIAACIEARFFEGGWSTPALLSIEGVQPFELYGYQSPLLWKGADRATPLSQVYGGGVNMLGFHSPAEMAKRGDPFILFSPDRKSARTVIRRYSGGLNGDGIEVSLRKFGDEWFVVDLQMRYVS